MSVLGKEARILFCEGQENSLDLRLMSRLSDGAVGWILEPARTKDGLARFAEGYVKSGGAAWLAVRDRDFDQDPSPTPTLLPDPGRKKQVLCLHRSAVESYMLDSTLIARYWAESEKGGRAEFRRPEPPESIEHRIVKAARAIAPYQAVRWALSKVRQSQPGRTPNTWTNGSGHLPPDLSLVACLSGARKLLSPTDRLGADEEITLLCRATDEYLALFESEDFIQNAQVLVWFSPKDIAKQMQRADANLFSMEKYFDWAVDKFDWTTHNDLRELATLLQSPTSLPAQ